MRRVYERCLFENEHIEGVFFKIRLRSSFLIDHFARPYCIAGLISSSIKCTEIKSLSLCKEGFWMKC